MAKISLVLMCVDSGETHGAWDQSEYSHREPNMAPNPRSEASVKREMETEETGGGGNDTDTIPIWQESFPPL